MYLSTALISLRALRDADRSTARLSRRSSAGGPYANRYWEAGAKIGHAFVVNDDGV